MSAAHLPPIRIGELRRRIDARLDPGGLRVVVVADVEVAPTARRIARVRGGRHLCAPADAVALARLLRAAGDAAVAVSGLEAFSEDEWKRLDELRSRLSREAPTVLVLSPRSADLLERAAPNLSSFIGPPLWSLEGTSDEADEEDQVAAQAEFDRFYRAWIDAVCLVSSLTRMVNDPAYQRIIAMGKRAIPPILRDLEKEPKLWGPALEAITGARPVPERNQGQIRRVAAAWLRWAKENGYDW